VVGEVRGFFSIDCLVVQELKINYRIKLSQADGDEKQTTKSKVYNKILHKLLINFHVKTVSVGVRTRPFPTKPTVINVQV